LCSVFIPVAFLGGLTGVLYKQFAITISISIVISGFVALSLTPALCAILLKPQTHAPKFFLFRWFNAFFDKITHAFSSTVSLMLKHTLIVLAVFALFIAATVKFAGVVPTALVPNEDQGLITVSTVLPDGTAQNQTADFMDRFSKICEKIPETESVLIFSGYSVIASAYLSNYGTAHITLKDWKERTNPGQDSFTLAKKIMGDTWNLPEGQVYAFNPPAIIGMSTTGGVEGYLQSRNTTDVNEINRVTQLFIEEAQKRPELSNVSTTFSVSVPQYYVNVDRVKLRSLGVTLSDLFNTMNNIFSSYYVNDFDKAGRTFEVLVSSKPMYRDYKDATKYTYVRADNGTMIPLDSLIDLRPITGPGMMTRFNVFPAAQLTAEPAAGYTSGQAIAAMEEVASTMPEGYYLEWTGTAYQENKTGSTTTVAFLLGIIMVFL
ncbi:MAG: efflux RND transporter permease subunit, partial [Synergistes sp.]|nr:efflux RND transporter permease subunit [Synergistes sp.]